MFRSSGASGSWGARFYKHLVPPGPNARAPENQSDFFVGKTLVIILVALTFSFLLFPFSL